MQGDVPGIEFRGQPLTTGIKYPNTFSMRLLRSCGTLANRFVLDVGAGDNPEFGVDIRSEGAMFEFVDKNQDSLKLLGSALEDRGFMCSGAYADVTAGIDMKDSNVDLAHMRFVLMHITPNQQRRAIAEVLRVTAGNAVFVEYDYTSIYSQTHQDRLEAFMEPFYELASVFQLDITVGERLLNVVQDAAGHRMCESVRYLWSHGQYTNHLIELCDRLGKNARNFPKTRTLAERFDELKSGFEKDPIQFTLPTLSAVIVTK